MIDWSLIQLELNVPGAHWLQGESRDLILSALEYYARRHLWHNAGAPLTDSEWDEVEAAIAQAAADVMIEINISPVGAIDWYAGLDPLPDGWLLCDGTVYNIADYPLLSAKLLATYGGNGTTTFAVPDIDNRLIRSTLLESELGDMAGSDSVTLAEANIPPHTHTYSYPAPTVVIPGELPVPVPVSDVSGLPAVTSSVGSGQSFSVANPYIRLRPIIRARGDIIAESEVISGPGAAFLVGEVKWLPYVLNNSDWLYCDGSQRTTAAYPDLFALIGYTYGGSGANFALPDLRIRFPLGTDGSTYPLAASGGETDHLLTTNEIPAHSHQVSRSTSSGSFRAAGGASHAGYFNAELTGGGLSHNNMPPYLTLYPTLRGTP
jgi:microcystin-dependent protein